jgi:hypothetical protein
MLPLTIAMSLPLFVMIGYALFSPNPAASQGADEARD